MEHREDFSEYENKEVNSIEESIEYLNKSFILKNVQSVD